MQAEHKIEYYDQALEYEKRAIKEWVADEGPGEDLQLAVSEYGRNREGFDYIDQLQSSMEAGLGGAQMNFPSWHCENDDPEDNTTHQDMGVLYDALVDTYNIDVPETESDSE